MTDPEFDRLAELDGQWVIANQHRWLPPFWLQLTIFAMLILIGILAGCSATPSPQASPSVESSMAPSVGSPSPSSNNSDFRGAVPDYLLNPAVTQNTIKTTICVSGWTDTIRPSSSYTTGLKRQQLVLLGYADQNLADYEEDHWIALELGGAPMEPRNLWPEPITEAHTKDLKENADKKAVCAGTMTLADARLDMYRNWHK